VGNGVKVLRGGETELSDISDPLMVLRINVSKFKNDELGMREFFSAIVDGLEKLKRRFSQLLVVEVG